MRHLFILFLPAIFCACGMPHKRAQEIFRDNKAATFTNVDSARSSQKEGLLFLVFNNSDSALYRLPVAKLLQYDTTKEDAYYYRHLCTQYAVIKLYSSEFDAYLQTLTDSTDADFRADGMAYDRGKPFMFICHRERLSFYGAMPMDTEKEYIRALIQDFMGP